MTTVRNHRVRNRQVLQLLSPTLDIVLEVCLVILFDLGK